MRRLRGCVAAMVMLVVVGVAPAAADPNQPTSLTLSGPGTVVDETSSVITIRWVAQDGTPISAPVQLVGRADDGTVLTDTTLTTGPDGTAAVSVAPRVDSVWTATGPAGPWGLAATSNAYRLDNLPPGRPVAYPRKAPEPAPLPAQPRATTAGADPVVTRIPADVWRSMRGRSWRPGCVPRSQLRLIRINYWGFDGYRHRGEMVVRVSIARRAAAALRAMYQRQLPIRAMYRVDRFGYSARSHGADDYAAMAHDDSSAFNCRWVTGRPGVRSPHSSGRAVDLNTWENPYVSPHGVLPDSWWLHRSDPRIAWRSSRHVVVRIWRRHGFHWTYGIRDSQHLDGRSIPSGSMSFVG